MYYLRTLSDKVRIPPELFGSDLEDAVVKLLRDKMERRIYKEYGIVLMIDNAEISGDGVVIPGDSGAYYHVKFDALTFAPQVHEVFEAEVKEIVEFGAFSSIGPFQGLLHVSQIGSDKFFYDKKAKTLVSRAEKKTLKKGDELIIKVSTVSLKGTYADTKIGLTMRPLGLGKAEWMVEKKAVAPKKEKGKKEGRS